MEPKSNIHKNNTNNYNNSNNSSNFLAHNFVKELNVKMSKSHVECGPWENFFENEKFIELH
jgi:hypothetical protein